MNESQNTPEYQAEYDKAMADLESAANGGKPAATTDTQVQQGAATDTGSADANAEASAQNQQAEDAAALKAQLEEARAELAKREKALQDTQRWGHENARRAKELEKAQRQKPELLQSVPELEEAVRHVVADQETAKQEEFQQKAEEAISTVVSIMPDVPQLLADPEFYKAMEARREAVGAEKFDTDAKLMIREIAAEKEARLRARFESDKAAAIEAARKQAEQDFRKKSSMTMPGASTGAGRVTSTKELTPEDIANMSDADFRRLQAKVSGF